MEVKKHINISVIIFITLLLLIMGGYVFFNIKTFVTYTETNVKKEENKSEEMDNTEKLLIELKNTPYYIEKRWERYLNYLEKYPDKSLEEIVRSVNANIDYEFYQHDIDTDTSVGPLMLVNKFYHLTSDYKPKLVKMTGEYTKGTSYFEVEAYEHLKDMINNAKNDNIILYNVSSYRSYETQEKLYNNYVKMDGVEKADRYSARAGYSEHQTGYTTDLNTASSSDHFENSKEFAWLSNNAYKYGFILRYPQDKEYLTGYKFEPWHYRYVGIEASEYIYKHNITLEEYYAYFVEQ